MRRRSISLRKSRAFSRTCRARGRTPPAHGNGLCTAICQLQPAHEGLAADMPLSNNRAATLARPLWAASVRLAGPISHIWDEDAGEPASTSHLLATVGVAAALCTQLSAQRRHRAVGQKCGRIQGAFSLWARWGLQFRPSRLAECCPGSTTGVELGAALHRPKSTIPDRGSPATPPVQSSPMSLHGAAGVLGRAKQTGPSSRRPRACTRALAPGAPGADVPVAPPSSQTLSLKYACSGKPSPCSP